jgi:hypothetical protein
MSVSGFVDNAKLITGPVRPDGTKGPDSLKILLRQWDDKSKNILLELNGREAQRTLNGINVLRQQGVPFIRFHGEIYIKVKDVVIPAAEGEQSSEEAPQDHDAHHAGHQVDRGTSISAKRTNAGGRERLTMARVAKLWPCRIPGRRSTWIKRSLCGRSARRREGGLAIGN